MIIHFKWYTHKRSDTIEIERGHNHFAMDDMDGSRKETTVLVNEGFDEHEGAHTPVGRHYFETLN